MTLDDIKGDIKDRDSITILNALETTIAKQKDDTNLLLSKKIS